MELRGIDDLGQVDVLAIGRVQAAPQQVLQHRSLALVLHVTCDRSCTRRTVTYEHDIRDVVY